MGNHAGWTEIINLGCWFLKRTAVDLLKHNKKIQQKQFSQTDIECVCKFTQIVTVHWEMLSCHYILKGEINCIVGCNANFSSFLAHST